MGTLHFVLLNFIELIAALLVILKMIWRRLQVGNFYGSRRDQQKIVDPVYIVPALMLSIKKSV